MTDKSKIGYIVSGDVEGDSDRLDGVVEDITEELPDSESEEVHPDASIYEFRDRVRDDVVRLVTFRIPFHAREDAEVVFDAVTDILEDSDDYRIRLQRMPVRGHSTDDIRQWYQDHPDEQPVNDEGEPYEPDVWDPNNHELLYESGEDA